MRPRAEGAGAVERADVGADAGIVPGVGEEVVGPERVVPAGVGIDPEAVAVAAVERKHLVGGDELENFVTSLDQVPDADVLPPTPRGRRAYFEGLRRVLLDVPADRGAGFFAWEPEWVPRVGWEPGADNPNDNMTMFDWQGRGLPSLAAFRPLRHER